MVCFLNHSSLEIAFMSEKIVSSEDVIHVLDKRLALKQMPQGTGFRTSLDSVMLAAACPAEENHHVLDLGCGVGSASLCLAKRVPRLTIKGIDILNEYIALAQENAMHNGFENCVEFSVSCVKENTLRNFDHVICNPPYLEDGELLHSDQKAKAIANAHCDDIYLEDWIEAAYKALKQKGVLTLIHRADHIDKIIHHLTTCRKTSAFGAIEIIPLWPKQNTDSKRVILRARKDSKSPAILHSGIILHKDNGQYTSHAEEILRGMQALL